MTRTLRKGVQACAMVWYHGRQLASYSDAPKVLGSWINHQSYRKSKVRWVTKIPPAYLPSPKSGMSMGPWHLTVDTSLQDASVASHAPRRSLRSLSSSPAAWSALRVRPPLVARQRRCEGIPLLPTPKSSPWPISSPPSAERLYIDGHGTFRLHERNEH